MRAGGAWALAARLSQFSAALSARDRALRQPPPINLHRRDNDDATRPQPPMDSGAWAQLF